MKVIVLTKGFETQVDNEDYDYLMQWNWHAHMSKDIPYSARCYKIRGSGYIEYMHKQIVTERMKLIIPENMLIDHKDRNSLNNQRYNFRIADYSINGLNARLRSNNTSGTTGVRYNLKMKAWTARIHINGQDNWLGCFSTEEAAKEARKLAEIKNDLKE